jgi:hypothetical protein
MKTESNGGSAETQITQKLARLYEVELDRAGRDFPTMRLPALEVPERVPRPHMKLRLFSEAVAIVAVGAIIVAGGWLAANPQTPAGPAPAASLPMGPDGIPNQINGERVYRIADKPEWEKLSGSFLLGSTPSLISPACIAAGVAGVAEGDLIQASCGPALLVGPTLGSSVMLAPKSASLIEPWQGSQIVVRVHTHDPEAASCAAANRATCDASVVVEEVVWPVIPTAISGERVYRATDQAAFSKLTPSFLLGGVFIKPELVPTCPMPIDLTRAEQQLLPYCFIQTIDGLQLSPKSNIDEPRGELVVVRAHVNDALAADCPAATQADCMAAIVVDSVVWHSDAAIQVSPSFGVAGPSSTAPSNGTSVNQSGPSLGAGGTSAEPRPGRARPWLRPRHPSARRCPTPRSSSGGSDRPEPCGPGRLALGSRRYAVSVKSAKKASTPLKSVTVGLNNT